MKEIRTMDELIEYASLIVNKELNFEPVNIIANNISFQVKIDGEDWDNLVDIRHAKYIFALQECVNDLLEEYGPQNIDEDSKIVKIEVRSGSSDILPDITEIVKMVVTPMTPEHTFVSAVIALLSMTGYFAWKRWVDYKQDGAALSEHEQTKRVAMNALIATRNVRDAEFAPYEKPVKALVGSLKENDTILFPGSSEISATRDEAKDALPKRRRSEEQTSYADGEYILNNIDYSHGELILHLSQDDQAVKAYTSQLSDDDAKDLFDDISARQLTEDLPLSLVLQINIKHTAKRIKFGSIVGTGQVRPDKHHVRISTLGA